MRAPDCANLRAELRVRSQAAHASLDAKMRQVGWGDRASYGRFLQIQHAARLPLERWASSECPNEIRPPRQSHLIECDLTALDLPCDDRDEEFALPQGADPIGLAWAIAGSSLGNLAILRDVTRGEQGSGETGVLPTAFLADSAMTDFWRSLRTKLEQPYSLDRLSAASLAAKAVFTHFHAATSGMADSGKTQ